jgi:uncharacterized protein with ParB-like and HNH nuclease domain
MISANKESLKTFFDYNKQYIVPFFQRAYVWNEDYWENLWEDIIQVNEKHINKQKVEHFFGTIITKQKSDNNISEQKIDLIDGQQRITTFAILFKALASSCSGNSDYIDLQNNINNLVVFKNNKGEPQLRIQHSKIDSENFENVMLGKSNSNNKKSNIQRCYEFYKNKLVDFTDEQIESVLNVLLNLLPVISMVLSPEDDEQEIFDTINSLGVRLSTSELLKNYIFQSKDIQPLYKDYWGVIFEDDEESIEFWNLKKTAGRISRTNIEFLLYSFLIINNKTDIKIELLFSEYKNWLKNKEANDKISFLVELKDYSTIYYKFPQGDLLTEFNFKETEKRFFYVIENLEITTVFPLVLYLRKKLNDQDYIYNLEILESYLVRRNICKYTTKNYNKGFIQIIRLLDEKTNIDKESLNVILREFTEDTNLWPTDIEFENSIINQGINHHINAKVILFCIALKDQSHGWNDISILNNSNYSVEHILPQKWETNWSIPNMDEESKLLRNQKLKTLGNLTIVRPGLNSKMKNSDWETKKKHLKEFSSLKITKDYLDIQYWNENEIEKRGKNISLSCMEIWKK